MDAAEKCRECLAKERNATNAKGGKSSVEGSERDGDEKRGKERDKEEKSMCERE